MVRGSIFRGRAVTVFAAGGALLLGLALVSGSATASIHEASNSLSGASIAGSSNDSYSSLNEEARMRDAMVSEEVSPGAFVADGVLILRIYRGAEAPYGATTLPSQFTPESLSAVERELAELANARDFVYGFRYDAETDAVLVVGDLAESMLHAESVEAGLIRFQFADNGGRQSRPRGNHVALVGGDMYASKWSLISLHLGVSSL